jgi:hypothetical protein
VCKVRLPYDDQHKAVFKQGTAPACPNCQEKNAQRQALNRRELTVGTLRPDIILYNEHHAAGDMIGERAAVDLGKRPDLLIVMGTSLKVPGIKRMVKDIARQIRQVNNASDGGDSSERIATLLINKTELAGVTEWKQVFDCSWIGEADEIVQFIEQNLREIESLAEDRRRRRLSSKRAKGNNNNNRYGIFDNDELFLCIENLLVNQRLITECLPVIAKSSADGGPDRIKRSPSVCSTVDSKAASVKENSKPTVADGEKLETTVRVPGKPSKSSSTLKGVRVTKSSGSGVSGTLKKPASPSVQSSRQPTSPKKSKTVKQSA